MLNPNTNLQVRIENSEKTALVGNNKQPKNDQYQKDQSKSENKVGVKGNNLSGGQKQRIAIARAVIRNPTIFMFDEATSALDAESEQTVQKAIKEITKNQVTTLSISHRVAAIKDSDLIFYLSEGQVSESGTYKELMDSQGEFYQMNFE